MERERRPDSEISVGKTVDAPASTDGLRASLQRKIARRAIARRAEGDGGSAEAAVKLDAAAATTGAPLPDAQRGRFEQSLGVPLDSVRVHTGGASADAASAVSAQAYTEGQSVHFGQGHYDPESPQGEKLLAHEVAHTVQQRDATPTRQNKLEVSQPGDAGEIEADQAAEAMVIGAPAHVGSGGHQISRMPTTDGAKVEAGKMNPGDGNKNLVLDWDKTAADMSLTPAQSDQLKKDLTLKQEFEASVQAMIAKETLFAGLKTAADVVARMKELRDAGDAKTAEEMRAKLFACSEYAVALTLNPSKSKRYKQDDHGTYCNVYTHDFVGAMGGYLPIVWWMNDDIVNQVLGGKEVEPVIGKTVTELNANATYDWLIKWGTAFGWSAPITDMKLAQETCNKGSVVVLCSKNSSKKSIGGLKEAGHVDIVLPEKATALPSGMAAQAGLPPGSDGSTKANDKSGKNEEFVPVQSMAGDALDTDTIRDKSNNKSAPDGAWWKREKVDGAAFVLKNPGAKGIATPQALGTSATPI